MLYYIEHLTKDRVFISSDRGSGITTLPKPFKAIQRGPGTLNILGNGETSGLQLIDVPDYDPKNREYLKLWPPHQQISYFYTTEEYTKLFGEVPSNPKVVAFDIEVGTSKDRPPNSDTDPIIMIGVSSLPDENGNYDVIIIDEKDETRTILKFLQYIIDVDPDIITGYFSEGFDVPFILDRMRILDIQFPEELHRTLVPNKHIRVPVNYMESPAYSALGFGRVHYDLFKSVKLDTSIKTKNIRMKTVAKYLGSTTVFDIEDDEKSSMLELYDNDYDKLCTYLESDIHQTMHIFNVYFPQAANMAALVCAPLDSLVNGHGRAPFPRLFMGKAFIDYGVYPVYKNETRNKQIFALTNDGQYRGAYTGIRKTGRFETIAKLDFSSMYPSIIVTFNISPDTVTFIGETDLIEPNKAATAKYRMSKGVIQDDYYPIITKVAEENSDGTAAKINVWIPDEGLGKYLGMQIDLTKKGIMPSKTNQLFVMRDDIRAGMGDMKKDSKEYKVADSRQNGVKIANNSNYGLFANKHIDTGDLPCAMLITGFGREITRYVCSMLTETVIEIDTDGFYLTEAIDAEMLNVELAEVIEEKFPNMPFKSRMILECEKENMPGIFMAMKNYVLMDPETREVDATGSSMKGSSKALFVENMLKKAAAQLIDNESPIVVKSQLETEMNLIDDPDQFKMFMRIKKGLMDYKMDGGLAQHMVRINSYPKSTKIKKIKDELIIAVDKEFEDLLDQELESVSNKLSAHGVSTPVDYFLAIYKNRLKEEESKSVSNDRHRFILLNSAEDTIINLLGSYRKKSITQNYRILLKAQTAGLQLLEGDSIEYYMACSTDNVEIFNKRNLKEFPINHQWYKDAVNSVMTNMLEAVTSQETYELF